MADMARLSLTDAVSELVRPLTDSDSLDPLMNLIGDARFVLIGEAPRTYPWGL